MEHIPYKGGGPAIIGLMAGETQLYIVTLASAFVQIKAGRLRPLAVTSRTRSKMALEIPTMIEAGLPDYEVNGWFGLLAPARTPERIILHLHQQFSNALKQKAVQERLAIRMVEPIGSSPSDFRQQIKLEIAKWHQVTKAAEIRGN